jgi:hypothetical protein
VGKARDLIEERKPGKTNHESINLVGDLRRLGHLREVNATYTVIVAQDLIILHGACMATRIHHDNRVAKLGCGSSDVAQTLSRIFGVKASWLWYLFGTSEENTFADVETSIRLDAATDSSSAGERAIWVVTNHQS